MLGCVLSTGARGAVDPDALAQCPQPDRAYSVVVSLSRETGDEMGLSMGDNALTHGNLIVESVSDTLISSPGQCCSREKLDSVRRVIAPSIATFRGLADNVIASPEVVRPLMERLAKGRDVVRIVHVGDSHIRGYYYSQATRDVLESVYGNTAVEPRRIVGTSSGILTETGQPGLVYQTIGINGATCNTYTKDTARLAEIAAQKPDLIILSFGTNEAHNTNYSEAAHTTQMQRLTDALRERCPDAVFLLTTSPGSYQNGRPNPRTKRVAANIVAFAAEHGMASWDMFTILGGDGNILNNWASRKMQRQDRVHFNAEGYTLMGRMLAEALLKL